MSKALVTIGSMTTHGGIVTECDTTFIINGIAVHLNGMKHFCPKCKTVVSAIASDQTTIVNGRAVVLAGDKTTCGATFLGNQHLVVSQPKSSSSTSSAMSKLQSTQSPIAKAALSLPNTAMSFSGADLPSIPQPIVDAVTGFGSAISLGGTDIINEKLGNDGAYNKDSTSSMIGGAAGSVIGLGKVKGTVIAAKEGLEEAGKYSAKNVAKFQDYVKDLRQRMEKPIVENPQLKSFMDKIYRDGAKIGSGSTADAVRYEKATGEKVGGREHTQKAEDAVKFFEKWLDKNDKLPPTETGAKKRASSNDVAAAENVLKDLKDALNGK